MEAHACRFVFMHVLPTKFSISMLSDQLRAVRAKALKKKAAASKNE